MLSLRYFSLLVLVLSLATRPSQAQKTDLTPLLPVRPLPQLSPAPGEVVLRQPAPLAAAPPPVRATAVVRPPGPLVLLNSRLITGFGGLSELNPTDIAAITIYKAGAQASTATPTQWRSLDANGIIDVTLKKKLRLKSQSLAQLGRHLQAKGPVSYLLNDLPAASGTLRIATEAIEEIQVVRTPAGTTLRVRMNSVSNRPTKAYPPGTILIRGTASR